MGANLKLRRLCYVYIFRILYVYRNTDFAYIGKEHFNGDMLAAVSFFRTMHYNL